MKSVGQEKRLNSHEWTSSWGPCFLSWNVSNYQALYLFFIFYDVLTRFNICTIVFLCLYLNASNGCIWEIKTPCRMAFLFIAGHFFHDMQLELAWSIASIALFVLMIAWSLCCKQQWKVSVSLPKYKKYQLKTKLTKQKQFKTLVVFTELCVRMYEYYCK